VLSIPIGLLDPCWCNKTKWIHETAAIKNGNKKCKLKNLFKVALLTAKPPQSHPTIAFPIRGIAEAIDVITVAPQKLICPHGNT
jgi:hypothetical protein